MVFKPGKTTTKLYMTLTLLAGVVAGLFLLASTADAVQIKRVQTGELYFDNDDISSSVDIQPVDLTKTIIMIYPSPESSSLTATQNTLFTPQFESESAINISRDGASAAAGAAVIVKFYVIEFSDGVVVQRGISSLRPGAVTNDKWRIKDIVLPNSLQYAPPVAGTSAGNSYAFTYVRSALTTTTSDEMATITAKLWRDSGVDKLRLERTSSNDVQKSVNIVWQVVEFNTDASIRMGTVTIANNQTSNTGTITPNITAGQVGKCLLIFGTRSGITVNGIEGLSAVRGDITNVSTVTFTRGGNLGSGTTEVNVLWYVIELTDPCSAVQKNNFAMASGTGESPVNLNPVLDPSRVMPLIYNNCTTDTSTSSFNDEILLKPDYNLPKGAVFENTTVGGAIWVCNYYNDTVTKYKLSDGSTTTYATGANPVAICYAPIAAPSIFVVNYYGNSVTKVVIGTGVTTTTALSAGCNNPIDICWDPSTSSVWTANYGGGVTYTFTKVNATTPATQTVVAGINNNPTGICYDPNNYGGIYYVWGIYASATGRLSRIATAAATHNQSANVLGTNQEYRAICYAPTSGTLGNNTLWVASLRYSQLKRVPISGTPPTLGTASTFPTDIAPQRLVWDSNQSRIWASCYGSNTLNRLNPTLADLSDATDLTGLTGSNPFGITFDSTNNKIWATSSSDRTLQKFPLTGTDPVSPELTVTLSATEGVINLMRNNTGCGTTVNWFMPQFCALTIVEPNGGDSWQVTQSQTIRWKYADVLSSGGTGTGGVHKVKLQISKDDTNWFDIPGATSLDINNASTIPNEGKFVWNPLPASIPGLSNLIGTTLKVRMWDTDKEANPANYYDKSNNVFNIKGKLTVNTPPTEEPNIWRLGTDHDITWHTDGNLTDIPSQMTIYLSTDGSTFPHTLTTTATPGNDNTNNSWPWQNIPTELNGENLIGTDNKIKIVANYTTAGTMESISNVFTLKGRIYTVAPQTAEIWLLGEGKTITWQKRGHFGSGLADGTVDIYYSNNAGLSYNLVPIATNVPAGTDAAGGTHLWTIPTSTALSDPATPTSKLKVVQSTDGTVYGESVNFYIKPAIEVISPNGASDIWRRGEVRDVQWKVNGAMNYVTIKYKVGAGSWTYIPGASDTDFLPAGTPGITQVFPWTIPQVYGKDNVLLRVSKKGEETIYDECNAPFSIKGNVTNVTLAPDPALVKVTNATENNKTTITWNHSDNLSGDVNIKLSSDSG